jgi:hypothetical protein
MIDGFPALMDELTVFCRKSLSTGACMTNIIVSVFRPLVPNKENRVLRRTFELKRDEGTGGWRKLRNEERHSVYYSPSIIRMVKSRR